MKKSEQVIKTKEGLFNDLLRYARLVWQTGNIHRLSPLVRLMIEEICNELYLLYGKLSDTDGYVFEKLVKNLSPSTFNPVRPGHAVLHLKPEAGMEEFQLYKTTGFHLQSAPPEFKERNISPLFTPLVDTKLLNLSISRCFCKNTLWSVDTVGNRKILARSDKKARYNTVWLGLQAGEGVNNLSDLPFYLDFPHLSSDHPYFDRLPEIQWAIQGKSLQMKQGLPLRKDAPPSPVEKDLLRFYKNQYQTLTGICLDEFPQQKLPEELTELIPQETAASLTPLYWLSITFPPHFEEEDVGKIRLLLNAFPVINRCYNECHLSVEEDLTKIVSLSSGFGEEFLEMDTVIQHSSEHAHPVTQYAVDPVRKASGATVGLSDYLEKLIDVLRDEKTAFPSAIDKEKVMNVFNAVAAVQESESFGAELNRLAANAEVARLATPTHEDTTSISIGYWNTHAGLLNGLPAQTILMAHKVPDLNKIAAVLITPVAGGRHFYDSQSRAAILQFYLTAKDRILTKNDIVNYCKIELGKYAREIQVLRNVRTSPKFKEGMIPVIEIRITPQEEHIETIRKNGMLKELRLRLEQRSPENFKYNIVLAT